MKTRTKIVAAVAATPFVLAGTWGGLFAAGLGKEAHRGVVGNIAVPLDVSK